MNILIVQDTCSLGGHTFANLDLAAGLQQQGHSVRAFFSRDEGCLQQFAAVCPAEVGSLRDLIRLVRTGGFHIVHADASMGDLPKLLRRAGFRGRLSLTRHHVDSTVGWMSHNCDLYIAVSETSAALMQPYTDLQVDVIPNGIAMATFRPVSGPIPDRPIIAWCGRSGTAFKNLPRFLAVTRLLGPDRYEFIIADGHQRPDAATVERMGGDDHISDWRTYRREEFPELYSRIARSGGCLLVTSKQEGLPVTLLEALSCGCPVIAADVRGVRDVLFGGMRRWLYPEDFADEAVAAFVTAALQEIRDGDLYPHFRDHIRDHFSQELMTRRYLDRFCDVLANGPTRRPVQPAQLTSKLWRAAAEMLALKRMRDAVFLVKSATRTHRASLFREPGALSTAVRAVWLARLAAARATVAEGRARWRAGDHASALRLLLRSAAIHPAVFVLPNSGRRRPLAAPPSSTPPPD